MAQRGGIAYEDREEEEEIGEEDDGDPEDDISGVNVGPRPCWHLDWQGGCVFRGRHLAPGVNGRIHKPDKHFSVALSFYLELGTADRGRRNCASRRRRDFRLPTPHVIDLHRDAISGETYEDPLGPDCGRHGGVLTSRGPSILASSLCRLGRQRPCAC
jgi:hypothetical protein